MHIERDDKIAKFWLNPVRLQKSGGFDRVEIGKIQRIIEDNCKVLTEAWNEYFGD